MEGLSGGEVDSAPPGSALPDHNVHLQFGNYGLNLDFDGYTAGYTFQKPIQLSIFYPTTGVSQRLCTRVYAKAPCVASWRFTFAFVRSAIG